jgi:hypothetical protein
MSLTEQGYGDYATPAERSGVQIPAGTAYFFSTAKVHTGSGAHPASYSMFTGSFAGVKRPGREVNHLAQHTVQVTNAWSYTSTAPMA